MTAEGRISPAGRGIWNDAQIEPLARINRFIAATARCPASSWRTPAARRARSARGRAARCPSRGRLAARRPERAGLRPDEERVPHALSREEIAGIVEAFRAADRARAGGRLPLDGDPRARTAISRTNFSRRSSNHRTDDYGGAFENRVRFVLEVDARRPRVVARELAADLAHLRDRLGGGRLDDRGFGRAGPAAEGAGRRPGRLLQRRQRAAREDPRRRRATRCLCGTRASGGRHRPRRPSA